MTDFVFATCLPGLEPAVKLEVARTRPDLRLARARPGLVLFRSDAPVTPADPPSSVFARGWGRSIGSARDPAAAAALLAPFGVDRVHVVLREPAPSEKLYDRAAKSTSFRAITATDRSTAQNAPRSRIAMTDVSTQAWRGVVDVDAWQAIGPGGPAEVGELVADLILAPIDDPMADEPEVAAWIGLHRHDASRAAEPGGGAPTDMPIDAPSHAFCKIEEAIAWAQLPMEAGQCAVELGAAPGGAVLALARRGLDVVAVDLGDLAAQVLASPGVTHLAKKVGALDRADLPARVDWLLVDMNLAPQVVLHEIAHLLPGLVPTLRGAVFTLKLPDWAVVDELPRLVAQIAAFGLPDVRLRHLPSNRREVCCVARPAR